MTRKPRRVWPFVVLALLVVPLFIRLGFWQLSRLKERRAFNAEIAQHLHEPPVPYFELGSYADAVWIQRLGDKMGRDVGAPLYRHVTLEGVPDYDHEFVLTGRSRNGSPGVNIITPVRVPGRDTAVLVNRGWVYAPDAATVGLSRWRENRTVFYGYNSTMRWPHGPAELTATKPKGRRVRELGIFFMDSLVPYPVYSRYIVSQDSQTDKTPARVAPPSLDDGPHLSYAIQWFSFAAIALVGATSVAIRSRRERGENEGA